MNYSDHVASYRDGLNKVNLYYDRIELGTLSLSTYRYEEIQSVKFTNIFIGTYLTLRLKNNRKKPIVMMRNKHVKLCKPLLDKFISNSQTSSGNPEGVYLRCTVLGGSGTALENKAECLVHFKDDTIIITAEKQHININLNELTELTLNGPVVVMPDISSSDVINNVTLHIAWQEKELFLHTTMYSPGEVRLLLSHAFVTTQSVSNKKVQEK